MLRTACQMTNQGEKWFRIASRSADLLVSRTGMYPVEHMFGCDDKVKREIRVVRLCRKFFKIVTQLLEQISWRGESEDPGCSHVCHPNTGMRSNVHVDRPRRAKASQRSGRT